MADKSVAFTVRRARLLLGMTVAEFAGLYSVDEATITQWECGLLHPNPETWARLRRLSLSAYSSLDEDLVRASPVHKYIADMKDLAHAIVASKAVTEALEAVGASDALGVPFDLAERARKSPHYEVSGARALEKIQAEPDWLRGNIVYAEIHCIAASFRGNWVDAMVAPLPDHVAAIIEGASSKRGEGEGFRVRLVRLQDMHF
jgi:transcriptional regulator with XRE-family HTH domain